MKKQVIIFTAVCASFLGSSNVLAFGNLSNLSTPLGGGAWRSGYTFSLSINVPSDVRLRPAIIIPTTPVMAPSINFDATQVLVHELPLLPLTLDGPESGN